MKATAVAAITLLAFAGLASAATYATIGAAVQGLPDTSVLASQYGATPISKQFEDPNLVATAFIPDNDGLNKAIDILKAAGFDESMISGQASVLTDALKYHVVPGKALKLADLKDGMKLATDSGESITVSVDPTTKAVTLIGGAPQVKVHVVEGDVVAGMGIVHVIDGVLLDSNNAAVFQTVPGVGDDFSGLYNAVAPTPVPTPSSPGTPSKTNTTKTPTTKTTDSATTPAPADSPAPSSPSSAAGLKMAAALVAVPTLLALL